MKNYLFSENKLLIKQIDITTLAIDAIVNAANTTLLGGGGVDGAIHRAAGTKLLAECRKLGGCKTGEAKITKAYKLPSKYVIHTVEPVWKGGNYNEHNLLKSCYVNCFKIAKEYTIQTIAFPSISTGAYRFPIDEACPIALETIKTAIQNDDNIQQIIIACFDTSTFQTYLIYANQIFKH